MNINSIMGKFVFAAAALALFAAAPVSAQKGGSSSTSPQEVRDVDAPTRQPFSTICTSLVVPSGAFQSNVCTINIPAGKRLVVEHVSLTAQMPLGAAQIPHFFIRGNAINSSGSMFLIVPATYVGVVTGVDFWVGSQIVRATFNEGTITVNMNRSAGLNAAGGLIDKTSVSVFGYLVDVQ